MICREAERLIDTFFDGELEGRLMREAALHVTRCRRCEGEIQDRERLHDLLKAAVDHEMAGMDLSSIWKEIEPAIDRERRGRKILSWRLAAASARMGGVLWGDRNETGGELGSREDSGGRSWLVPRVAGLAVLAASLVLAVSLATREGSSPSLDQDAQVRGERVAAAPGVAGRRDATALPAAVEAPTRVVQAARPAESLVQPVAARTRRRGGQVQIESVDSRVGAMAMWSVPASDTAVIWLGDADPRVRQPR